MLPNATKIWAVPSSKCTNHDKSLKELTSARMKSRFDISNEKHFDDYVKARSSCYLVEQDGNDFYCDCYEGMKARYCKHSVGLMYKTELLEVSSEVRSKPLGQKRKRGRPKKLPACLTKSPQPQIPNSTYHSPSPNVSLNLTMSPTGDSSTPPQSQATRRSPQGNQIVSIIRNQKRSRELEECSDLPPAKRKSRAQKVKKVKIVDNNIEKRMTRSSKRINNKI